MKTNGNDKAFYTSDLENLGQLKNIKIGGLTKREYFASLLMTGYADRQGNNYQKLAEWSVIAADALIAELNKNMDDKS